MESQSDYSTRGCLLGKTVSPRLQQLEDDFMDNGGCFKEFRIGDLFSIHTGGLLQASELKSGTIPRISVTSSNNGIIGYYDTAENDEARHFSNFISVNFFGNCFYHPYKASLEMKVHVLHLPGYEFTSATGLYIASALNRVLNGNYSYGEQLSSSDLKKQKIYISLPIRNDDLAFDYMESYIRELEQERIRELDAYLKATGLNDYELTPEEKNSIEIMSKGGLNYKEFKVLDIFTVKNTQSVMKSQVDFCSGDIPYVTAGETNNSIASYISAEPSIIDKGNCIVIGGKSTVVTYQEQDFVSNDSHNLALYMKETDKKSKYTQMFFVTLLSFKLKQLYNWGNSISNKKIQKDTIHVPVNQNGDIDYQFIELYSKAVEKLCIKSVVDWKDRIIQTTKNVANC